MSAPHCVAADVLAPEGDAKPMDVAVSLEGSGRRAYRVVSNCRSSFDFLLVFPRL